MPACLREHSSASTTIDIRLRSVYYAMAPFASAALEVGLKLLSVHRERRVNMLGRRPLFSPGIVMTHGKACSNILCVSIAISFHEQLTHFIMALYSLFCGPV